jgi:tRNA(Arg) A34 adenosine deaminase TadA
MGDPTDAELMGLALDEARSALDHDDVPIGAVVMIDGEIVARRHNERERTGDPTAHAEVLALRDAAAAVGSWRLDGASLVVTLEPCAMCAGAAVNARVPRVVFGARNLDAGPIPFAGGLGRQLESPTESCQSGRMGRPRKPLWVSAHRGFESLTLRHLISAIDRRPRAPVARPHP